MGGSSSQGGESSGGGSSAGGSDQGSLGGKGRRVLKQDETKKLSQTVSNIGEKYVEQIKLDMAQGKYFLIPDITLEMLANELKIPAKNLSITLNRQFNKNFYEFINDYRIEEAKLLLVAEENKDKTITEIYLEVGFNSKSVFNTFFKKSVGLTPSQFRKTQQPLLF